MKAGDRSVSFRPFYSVQDPAHGMTPSSLRVGVPMSVKTLWKYPDRCAHKRAFQVILKQSHRQ